MLRERERNRALTQSVLDRQKIAVVGPFPPIRSGIAKHTEAVARAFEAREDIEVRRWGFSKQYPAVLYPGGSERDIVKGAQTSGVAESLSGPNPLTWRRTAREIQLWNPSTLIMPAWTFAVAPALGWIARQVSASSSKVCMIVHNAYDHESHRLKDRLTSWQLSAADRFVTHNIALAKELETRFPEKPAKVFPHPTFDDVPVATGQLARRSKLELLFFGLVRPYKGLDILLDAMSLVTRDDVSLTIAGEFWQHQEETQARIDRLGPDHSVELLARYVGDDEMAELFDRADAVVLPYRSVSGSGVVSLAFHYQKPIIASDLPGFAEILRASGAGWLFKTGDAADLAATIDRLGRDDLAGASEAAGRSARELTWSKFVSMILCDDENAGAKI
ncbi:putative glycosyl transferase [Rhodobacteraceae bacterium KLH11]|nr:putative glycosyl transferase [Rhodobacteraceae bacterium KLH11]